jgi:hypothetical protein
MDFSMWSGAPAAYNYRLYDLDFMLSSLHHVVGYGTIKVRLLRICYPCRICPSLYIANPSSLEDPSVVRRIAGANAGTVLRASVETFSRPHYIVLVETSGDWATPLLWSAL